MLTGETGAGKSILLDALGLALGRRAEAGLVRPGAEQAAVSAEFAVGRNHPAHAILREAGLDGDGEAIVLRRLVGADGRSRAFVNDEPASVGLLRELGDSLVEIQGQFEQRGLLDPATHRMILDAFAEHSGRPRRRSRRPGTTGARRGSARPKRRGCSPRAATKRTCCATTSPSSMRWRRKTTRRIASPPGAPCCRTPSGWPRP